MNKIGYLFICASELNQNKIWENYFKCLSLTCTNYQIIFLFYKTPPKTIISGIKNIRYINVLSLKPGWGNINYIKCMLYGLEVIFKEYLCTKALIFSESCIPIHNPNYIHTIINNTPKSLLHIFKIDKNDNCFKRIESALNKTFFENKGYIYKYYAQGLCINKDLYDLLNKTKNKYINEFKLVKNIDEHYIGCVIQSEDLDINDFIEYKTMMYFNWNVIGFNNRAPYTYLTLDKELITFIGRDFLFLRKVHKSTIIKCDILALTDHDYNNSKQIDLLVHNIKKK